MANNDAITTVRTAEQLQKTEGEQAAEHSLVSSFDQYRAQHSNSLDVQNYWNQVSSKLKDDHVLPEMFVAWDKENPHATDVGARTTGAEASKIARNMGTKAAEGGDQNVAAKSSNGSDHTMPHKPQNMTDLAQETINDVSHLNPQQAAAYLKQALQYANESGPHGEMAFANQLETLSDGKLKLQARTNDNTYVLTDISGTTPSTPPVPGHPDEIPGKILATVPVDKNSPLMKEQRESEN